MANDNVIYNLQKVSKMLLDMSVAIRDLDCGKQSYQLFKASECCDESIKEMKKHEPVEAEIEGGGFNWWYVCGECHTAINPRIHYCPECGHHILWDGVGL